MADFDAIVIGAGVIGIAAARKLALSGKSVLLLEGERHYGSETSSRNSEVIHAGIYYDPGSLKARSCVRGRQQLYDFCESRHVPFKACGKVIFACSTAEADKLEIIMARAAAAGVLDLQMLDQSEASLLEPALECHAAILSPSTGILDSHAFMTALLGEAEDHGALYVAGTKVSRLSSKGSTWRIHVSGEADPVASAPIVVNAAGLGAQDLARRIDNLSDDFIPRQFLARGVYFIYTGRVPFSRLIYPIPVAGGLGTHLTLDMAGQARFGPDVEWIDSIDYRVDPARQVQFMDSVARMSSYLDPSKLVPGYAGIRPKISGPDEPAADFMISGPSNHGLPGLVNLFGIESPGLTASLALADEIEMALR